MNVLSVNFLADELINICRIFQTGSWLHETLVSVFNPVMHWISHNSEYFWIISTPQTNLSALIRHKWAVMLTFISFFWFYGADHSEADLFVDFNITLFRNEDDNTDSRRGIRLHSEDWPNCSACRSSSGFVHLHVACAYFNVLSYIRLQQGFRNNAHTWRLS
jgi:hypothetical protein